MSTVAFINIQSGTSPIVPTGGTITINGASTTAGSIPVQTVGTGVSTFETRIQLSQAIASTDASKVGLCSFNSAQFAVDANGYVTSTGGTLAWVNVTGTTQTVAASTGYLSNNGGTVTFDLPASSTVGDVFRIVGVQGAWTLTQAAGQQILFGSVATTVGVGGSLSSTNAGNCIECVATNTSASSIWRVMSVIGNVDYV